MLNRLLNIVRPNQAKKLYIGRGSTFNPSLTPFNRDMTKDDNGAALAALIIEDVYTAINTRTKAVGSLEWALYRMEGDSPNTKTDTVLCSSTSPEMTHSLAYAIKMFRVHNGIDLFELWNYCQLVTGKMFLQGLSNGFIYNGIEWYNPLSVEIDDPNGIIQGYRYYGKAQSIPLDVEKIIYDRYSINLLDENRPISPVESAIDSLNIHRNMKRALLGYFRNSMRIGAIVSPKEGNVFTDNEMDELIREMKTQNQGVDNTGKNLFIPYEADITFPSQPNLEQNDAVAERISKSINKALRVPDSIAGDMSNERYKESMDKYAAWFATVPIPDAKNIQDVINMRLMPLFDNSGKVYFAFNTSEWQDRVTQADIDRREAARMDLDAGAITVDEYRTSVGLEADDTLRISDRTSQIAINLYNQGIITLNSARNFMGLPNLPNGDILNVSSSDIQISPEKLGDLLGKPSYLPFQSPQTTPEQAMELEDLNELKAWKTASIPNYPVTALRGDIEHYINAAFADDENDIFEKALKRFYFVKAIQATRIEFELLIEDLIAEARSGNVTRVRFGNILRNGIRRWGRQAYIDGLVDGGVIDGTPDDDDEKIISQMIRNNSQFVTSLGDTLYKEGGITDKEADEKPLLWWNKTLMPFYNAGLLSANRNGMLEFVGEDGVESCQTCIVLKGQRHRAKEWAKRELRPGIDTQNFGCGGWQCKHILVPTKERARGKFPTPDQIARWVSQNKCVHHTHSDNNTPQPYTDREYKAYYNYDWNFNDML